MMTWNVPGMLSGVAAISIGLITTNAAGGRQPPPAAPSQTQVVLLGTGNPPADPDRSGPATAVVVNGAAYLVDFGAGVVRRAKSAAVDRGIAALEPVNLRVAFVTHLHSDHTVGYPDLMFTPWVIGRRVPLEVYGPSGIKAMTGHLLDAYSADFETRTKDRGLYRVGAFPEGRSVNVHEIGAGVVYKDANVTVTAFATKHAMQSSRWSKRKAADPSPVPTSLRYAVHTHAEPSIHRVIRRRRVMRTPSRGTSSVARRAAMDSNAILRLQPYRRSSRPKQFTAVPAGGGLGF